MSGRHAADWARCRGPLNAAILSLQRLSWRMVGPFTWLTDQNVEVSPLKCSPKLIADMMRDALRRSHQRAYASKCGGRFEGRRACMDTVVAMLKGKVLQPSGKGALYALVCRSFWTNATLADAGYDIGPECAMCGASRDDVHHRCWECPHSAPARAQASPGLLRLVASLPRGDPMVTAGVYPHPADEALLPPAEGGCVVYRREGLRDIGDHVRLSGFVFPDGTCTRPILRDLARAAWAVAVVPRTACFASTPWARSGRASLRRRRLRSTARTRRRSSSLVGLRTSSRTARRS